MKNKKGSFLINTGLRLIIASVLLTGYNIYSGNKAADSSMAALNQLNRAFATEKTDSTIYPADVPDYILNPDMVMPTKNIDGWEYIGVLDIPDLELNLPVIESYSRQAIKIAPACYGGSAYKDDFVICAHNYVAHFGKIGNLSAGNQIAFTDIDGNIFNYKVIEKETLSAGERERLFSGDWPLTLVSCTASGQARIAVRCNRI